jgi:tRNA A37 threonylcarbamoyladenosine modification protein TsaB
LNRVVLLKDKVAVDEEISNRDSVCIVRDILKKNGVEIREVESYDCEPGPEGSFTGLKIAAAIANTLNWSQNKDAKAIIPKYQASKYDN